MKRQRKSNPTTSDGDDAADHDTSMSGSSSSRTRSRKRTIQQPQGSEKSMAPTSSVPMSAFSNLGALSSIGGEFPSAQVTGLMNAASSFHPYVSFRGNAQAGASPATANVTALLVPSSPGGELSHMYAGNIAAACELANQEVAQRQKESSKDDNEEIQRKKAASRIVAWQSRERKRIEMEVLQERKAELIRNNASLTRENGQLKLLIANLKAIGSNHVAPSPFAQAEPFAGATPSWTESGLQGMTPSLTRMLGTLPPSRSESGQESMQPSLQTYPSLFQSGQALFGYPSATGTVSMSPFFNAPMFLQQSQGLGEPPSSQQHNTPIGLSLADFAGMQPRLQTQQRPPQQDTAFPNEAASRKLLGLDEVAPLACLQGTLQSRQSTGVELRRYAILPHPPQPDDLRRVPPLDITALLLPPGKRNVDVPLVRAVPKRRDIEDTQDDSKIQKNQGR